MYSPYPFNPNTSPWTPPFPYNTNHKEAKRNIKIWKEFEKEFEKRARRKKHGHDGHSGHDHDKDGHHHKKKRLTIMEIMMLLTAFSPIIGLVYAASILLGIRWILSMASTVVK